MQDLFVRYLVVTVLERPLRVLRSGSSSKATGPGQPALRRGMRQSSSSLCFQLFRRDENPGRGTGADLERQVPRM